MRDEIRRIQRGSNIATLLITHDQDEALSLADRVVLLREGRFVQAGSPQEIYDAPADAFVAGFVGRANLLDATVIDAETVDAAIGRLATPRHGHAAGSALRLLVRPERIEIASIAAGENVFPARVLRDRFFGATRCCCPPESCAGKRSASPVRPTSSSISAARRRRSSSGTSRTRNGYATFSHTRMCGNNA